MNENLDLIKILKNVPRGTKLYSTIQGDVIFTEIANGRLYPIKCTNIDKDNESYHYAYTTNGKFIDVFKGECVLFPSKEQRDWAKFKTPIPHKHLVWAWDDCSSLIRDVGFYDAINDCIFSITGKGEGYKYDNYEYFVGEWPQWAKEASTLLRD